MEETITEALKHGGITNMMDRLSNPAKLKAFELSEELKKINGRALVFLLVSKQL